MLRNVKRCAHGTVLRALPSRHRLRISRILILLQIQRQKLSLVASLIQAPEARYIIPPYPSPALFGVRNVHSFTLISLLPELTPIFATLTNTPGGWPPPRFLPRSEG